VLQSILSELRKDLPVPIAIVQHIAKGFLEGMVDWLGKSTAFPTHIAGHSETLLPGHAYFAPDGKHMEITRDGRAFLNTEPPDSGLRPSATHLFRSVSRSYGRHAIGVILTGMGADGAAELKCMRDEGAVTIAQDQASSLVHGMPGEAIKLSAAQYILPPKEIVATLERLVKP
jgi:two-component system chemotaxis response regulator CheB